MKTDSEILKNEIIDLLNKTQFMVLATSEDNKVTARTMSIVNDGLKVYFQTDKNFLKYKQIKNNKNVALCVNNIQVEGTAVVKGHPLDNKNSKFIELFKKKHENSFKNYSHLKDEVVIEVMPKIFTLWKYLENKPCRDFFYVDSNESAREYFV